MNKALFLDRDGTINVEKSYLHRKDEFHFVDGICDAIKRYQDNGYLIIVITNQSGIARGYYSEEDVENLHNYIDQCFACYGITVNKWYYCPHHPVYGLKHYKCECDCRKPKTGMIKKAIEDFEIDVSQSLLVGDSITDIECGQKMNIQSMYVWDFLGDKHNEK